MISGEGHHNRKRESLPLTPRNIEALKARFREGSRKEGGRSLGIADVSMRWHMARVCRVLGVSNAEEAAYVLWLRDLWEE